MGSIDSKHAHACPSAEDPGAAVDKDSNNDKEEEQDDASAVVVTHSGLRLRHLDGNNYLGRLQDAPGFSGGGGGDGSKSGAAAAATAAVAALMSSRLFRGRSRGGGCDCCCGCCCDSGSRAGAIGARAAGGGGGSSASSCRTSVSSGGGSRFSSAQESPSSAPLPPPPPPPYYAWLGGRGCCNGNYTGLQQQQHRYDHRQESHQQYRHANLSTLLARGFDPVEYERRAVETAAARKRLREGLGGRSARVPVTAETVPAAKVLPEAAK